MKEPKLKILTSEMLWFDEVHERLISLKTNIGNYELLKTPYEYYVLNSNEEDVDGRIDNVIENCLKEMEDLFDKMKTTDWEGVL